MAVNGNMVHEKKTSPTFSSKRLSSLNLFQFYEFNQYKYTYVVNKQEFEQGKSR